MKKWKQLTKTILASVMAFAMVVGYGASVSATPGLQDEGEAILTKILEVPQGVAIPGKVFTFMFEKVGIQKADETTVDDSAAALAKMEGITNATIAFTLGQTTGITDPGLVTGYKDVLGKSSDVLAGVTWPHAGVFIYAVSEVPVSPDPLYRYSTAKYTMKVYVQNVDASGDPTVTPTGLFKVTHVGFEMLAPDGRTPGATGVGDKVEPVFTNRHIPRVKLDISKRVAGEFADHTLDFTFTPTFIRPVDSDAVESVGTVVDTLTGSPVTPSRTIKVTFAANSPMGTLDQPTFRLRHGETLRFEGVDSTDLDTYQKGTLPAGTVWTVEEAGTPGYRASASVNNNSAIDATITPGTAGMDYSIASDGTNPLVAGDSQNRAVVTNTYKTITPTGILLNNLPYILLIVVALGGFAGYIVSKRRKAVR